MKHPRTLEELKIDYLSVGGSMERVDYLSAMVSAMLAVMCDAHLIDRKEFYARFLKAADEIHKQRSRDAEAAKASGKGN